MSLQPSCRLSLPLRVMTRWLPLGVALAACGGGFHTPPQDATVGVVARAMPLQSGGHELSVSRVRLVLDSLELTAADGSTEAVTGPFLVDAPLDGHWTLAAKLTLPRGSYSALKLNLRPLSSSSAADLAAAKAAGFEDLLDANTALSIDGKWDGQQFSQRPKGPSAQTLSLPRPWAVKLGTPANLSLEAHAEQWFPREPNGELADPRGDDADDVLAGFVGGLEGVTDDDRNGVEDP